MSGIKNKIVFFYKKKQQIAGSLLMYLNLAKYITETRPDYDVFYINYYNEYINDIISGTTIQFRDVETCTFDDLGDAVFIVSLNYIQVLLEKISALKQAKILLIDWHPYLADYLIAQFDEKMGTLEPMFQLFHDTDALSFMDSSCLSSVERRTNLQYNHNYVPVFVDQNINRYTELPLIGRSHANIGWLGRLDKDKIYSLINLADNLLNIEGVQTIDLHIIGDGDAKSSINMAHYSPKIRFIFTSYLIGDDLYQYLKEHIDILVAMGMSALNGAEIGIPTILPIVSNKRFYSDKYIFLYDSFDFSLGWRREDLAQTPCTCYTIQQIINKIKSNEEKIFYGHKCYDYLVHNHSIELAVKLLFENIQKTSLTVDKCLNCEPISIQWKDFQRLYSTGNVSNFENYVTVVQQRNVSYRLGNYEKIRHLLKDIVWDQYGRRVLSFIKKGFQKTQFISAQNNYDKKVANIAKKLKRDKQLKVAFIVLYESTFPTRSVFEQMLLDEAFDPYIIVSADVQRGIKHQLETYHNTLQFFEKKYPGRVIRGYDEEWDLFVELKDEYPIVFFANPYPKMAHPYHHITYFLDKDVLPVYAYYGFAAVKYGRNLMGLDMYNYTWKLILDSEISKKDLKKYQPIKARNALVTSYIKMDELAKVQILQNRRKKILICPHHTIMGWKALDISNFLKYSQFITELPSRYPNIDFVFRPHPLLFSNLLNNNIWSEKEIQNYLDKLLRNPNAVYDTSGDYFDTFMNSDAMIHDCSSFIGEYLFTEKPCCYMLKSDTELDDVFLPLGKMCLDNYYKAFSEEDILYFIDHVVINNEDPLKQKREMFSRTVLKTNFPHSSAYVVNDIKAELKKHTDI